MDHITFADFFLRKIHTLINSSFLDTYTWAFVATQIRRARTSWLNKSSCPLHPLSSSKYIISRKIWSLIFKDQRLNKTNLVVPVQMFPESLAGDIREHFLLNERSKIKRELVAWLSPFRLLSRSVWPVREYKRQIVRCISNQEHWSNYNAHRPKHKIWNEQTNHIVEEPLLLWGQIEHLLQDYPEYRLVDTVVVRCSVRRVRRSSSTFHYTNLRYHSGSEPLIWTHFETTTRSKYFIEIVANVKCHEWLSG